MSVSIPLFAIDLGLGAIGYYSKWSPAWRSGLTNFESQPDYLAGPIFSIGFLDDWNVSIVALSSLGGNGGEIKYTDYANKGYQDTDSLATTMGNKNSYIDSEDISAYSTRWDVDATLAYKITKIFRVYAGYKYLYNKFTGENTVTRTAYYQQMFSTITMVESFTVAMESKFESHSGGIGLGLTIPLVDSLFLLANVSSIYVMASLKVVKDVDYNESTPYKSFYLPNMDPGNRNYRAIGFNSTLALSYYFNSINTTVALGGRYQMIRYNRIKDDPYHIRADDIYYGVMLSALYYITF